MIGPLEADVADFLRFAFALSEVLFRLVPPEPGMDPLAVLETVVLPALRGRILGNPKPGTEIPQCLASTT